MKKKVIIGILIIVIVVIISYLFLFKEKYTIITLDINPSLELKVDKKENVVEVTALNDDAKSLVPNKYKNKNIDEVLMGISEKIIENVDNEGKKYVILLHIDGNISEDKVNGKIVSLFEERHMAVNVIVPKVIKKDEKKAKELNITPAKAAYLSEVVKSNSDLKIEDIKDKPVSELNEMKETGRYCDSGYTLDGDSCVKELRKQAATSEEVCPNGYYDYEGICYEEVPSDETNKLTCRDGFSLEGTKCVKNEIEPAEHQRICKSGYTLVNHDRCINKNKTASKETGYICDMPDSRLKGNTCILYERVEAKYN